MHSISVKRTATNNSGKVAFVDKQRRDLETWLEDYIAGEKIFINDRKLQQAEIEKQQAEILARRTASPVWQEKSDILAMDIPETDNNTVKMRGDGTLQLPSSIPGKIPVFKKTRHSQKLPFDPANMLYRGIGNIQNSAYHARPLELRKGLHMLQDAQPMSYSFETGLLAPHAKTSGRMEKTIKRTGMPSMSRISVDTLYHLREGRISSVCRRIY